MQHYTICPAGPDDAARLDALEQAVFDPATHPRLSRRQYRHLLTRGNALVLCACNGEALAGSLTLLMRRGSRVGRIYSLAVAQPFRGSGVARQLVEVAEAEMQQRGLSIAQCEIREDNIPSQRLFAALGYGEVARLPDYYPDHAGGIKYRKILRSKEH